MFQNILSWLNEVVASVFEENQCCLGCNMFALVSCNPVLPAGAGFCLIFLLFLCTNSSKEASWHLGVEDIDLFSLPDSLRC